jgi:act minimal PKS acyl carrier protein
VSKLEFALDDLRRILREGAGAAEGLDLNGDILDQEFSSLGYDSLALLETGGRIAREYRVELADTTVTSAQTPRELIEAVNTTLSATTTD